MKRNLVRAVSFLILSVANNSASAVSDWRLFQLKVPEKLVK